MEHAWLDSLSDDWIPQNGSDESLEQLPPKTDIDRAERLPPSPHQSRIPLRSAGSKPLYSPSNPNSSNILIERSANEINISRNRPSKLSNEVRLSSGQGRSISLATDGSVVHKKTSLGTSPDKDGQTPEWKRRLLHGDVQYGEQRDLFCSVAAGLQDMFKPPNSGDQVSVVEDSHLTDQTIPSSPPVSDFGNQENTERLVELALEEDSDVPEQVTPSPSPRRPRRAENHSFASDNLSSHVRDRAAKEAYRESPIRRAHGSGGAMKSMSTVAPGLEGEIRKPSVPGDTLYEDFSAIVIGKQNGENGQVEFAPVEVHIDQLCEKLEELQSSQLHSESIDGLNASGGHSVDRQSEIDAVDRFKKHGAQINLRRGGRSADNSFYHRALSPELVVDTSEMLPEESLQASTPKQFPTIRTDKAESHLRLEPRRSPSLPRAPFPSPEKRQASNGKLSSSGSPLKLFGPYDTFTNQTLLRRISQYEDVESGGTSTHSPTSPMDPITHQKSPSSQNGGHDSAHEQQSDSHGRKRVLSVFGGGKLEGFQFTGDISNEIIEGKPLPSQHVSPVPSYPLAQKKASHPSPQLQVRRRRERSASSLGASYGHNEPIQERQLDLDINQREDIGLEAKRPRTSPVKDPTPKRRRTLHRSDIAFEHRERGDSAQKEQDIFLPMGKRREDTSSGGFKLANPEVLASRSILQPHSPASSLENSSELKASLSQDHNAPNKPQSKPQSGGLSNETCRKPSIRTQDFVDQAAQIMAMIRSQVKPPGMASVEESEAENLEFNRNQSDFTSHQDSTYERLSRPPSREGKSAPLYADQLEDPDLENRLKQYRDFSDMGDIISSSMRSVSLAQHAIRAAQEFERHINIQKKPPTGRLVTEGEVVSDIPNVRISINPDKDELDNDYHSSASEPQTNNSAPTTSSKGSESRRTILPDTVSHLIPDRVGSMCLDKNKNIWIKQKSSSLADSTKSEEKLHEDSDEDPFASIPDLSVNLTQELASLGRTVNPTPMTSGQANQSIYRVVSVAQNELAKLGNRARIDAVNVCEKPASPEHKSTMSTSTRRKNMAISFSSPIASIIQDVLPEDLDSLEDDDGSYERSDSVKDDLSCSPTGLPPGSVSPQTYTQTSGRSTGTEPRGYSSMRSRGFIPRPVSRIDEQDEDSTVELPVASERQLSIIGDRNPTASETPDRRQASLSVLLSHASNRNALALIGDESSLIGQNIGKLSLSPLSEFTLNQVDQSFGFEVSYIMGQRHLSTGDGSRRVMSITIRDLVDKLGEVEPFEPYWEDITELDLSDKGLCSLHMLDEFCGKVISLDACMNKLGHLDGVPSSVRQLKVSQNKLTELSSWDHLLNLQYLDISNNEITNLAALKNLVHLRSVKADNNQLTNLDGLYGHDGLLSLRARGNRIEQLDFEDTMLTRLNDLDLEDNKIHTVCNLQLLPALTRLQLSRNKLKSFSFASKAISLRLIDLSDNMIEELDLTDMPHLHTLHVDRNFISRVSGLHRARRLDSLSLREQQGPTSLQSDFLVSGCEIRKLYLSGNFFGSLELKVDMLNLQLLEMANCGLGNLPKNIGQLTPNLRALNINFNAIADLSPLQYIPRLKKLMAAGNRLVDSTSVTELLTDFPHLTALDVRDNPITLGFYAPSQALVSTEEAKLSRFQLPDSDEEKDVSYASRLDDMTKLRRRLHHVVLSASCKRLRMLDGLVVRRDEVLAVDTVLESLISEGLLPDMSVDRHSHKKHQPNTETQDAAMASKQLSHTQANQLEEPQSSRWNAEDSFE